MGDWRDSYDAWKLRSDRDDEPERECSAWRQGCWGLPSECDCDDCLDDAERLAATDPDAPYCEADLREWSEEICL